MGFFKVEDFDNTFEWNLNIPNNGFINVLDVDYEHLQEEEGDLTSIGIIFNRSYQFQEATLSKQYFTPIYFKFKDVYGKDVLYDTLRITYNYEEEYAAVDYKKPSDFKFTVGLKRNGIILREWFLPLITSCGYTNIDLDLQPLFEKYNSYDELYISIINNPGNGKLYLGTAYLVQDSDELHNIKLAIADMLHLKYKKHLTNLKEDVVSGDPILPIIGTSDVMKGTSIMLGEGQLSEVHVIKSVDLTSDDVANVSLMDEFDSKEIQYSWSAGTPIYRVIPASIVEMRDAESIFPLFFIYAETYTNYEEAMHTGHVWSDYVRDLSGNHTVAVRRAWDSVSSNITVNIYSNVPEVAQEMWRYLKGVITTRDTLKVAGREIQYVITGERDVSPEDAEVLPNYVMDLTFYFRHNVYDRKYVSYPRFSSMQLAYEIKAVEVIK